jgi:putative ABC transport system permease protein
VWFASVRDLQWRSRRFLLGTLAAALLFGVTLVFEGLATSLEAEAGDTIEAVGADLWFTTDAVSGPLTGASMVPESRVAEVQRLAGVTAAEPLLLLREGLRFDDRTETVLLFGHLVGGWAAPDLSAGRPVAAAGEIVVDRSTGARLGDQVEIGGSSFTVVGEVMHRTAAGGIPSAFAGIDDAQAASTQGLDIATAVVARGSTEERIAGLRRWSNGDVRDDLLRPAGRIVQSIDMVKVLLWIAAAGVIASLVYLTTRERHGEFAVLKAIGVPTRAIVAGSALQALAVSVTAAALGAAGSVLVVPRFPVPLLIPARSVAVLFLAATVIAVSASVAAMRTVLTVDPATAFGGS